MKPRHHLYLDDDLTAELEAASRKPGASKSGVVARALRAYLRREGGRSDLEIICARLDKQEARMKRLEHDNSVLVETLSTFVYVYYLTTAHLQNPDEAGKAKAARRYDLFLNSVGSAVVKTEKRRAEQAAARATPTSQPPRASSSPEN